MTKVRKTQLGQMIRRTQTKLIRDVRLGTRKKRSGRSLAMNDLDEQFVLNCIETKTTAHGRRQDQVMYTGRRVKKRDFLKLVNYHRLQRGKHPIKSATTVYNRFYHEINVQFRLKNILGWACFARRSPPKLNRMRMSLHTTNELIRKNMVHHFHADERKEGAQFVCEMSLDDKAYLCPATSTGMRGAKNEKNFPNI